jgi:hypothetical protein
VRRCRERLDDLADDPGAGGLGQAGQLLDGAFGGLPGPAAFTGYGQQQGLFLAGLRYGGVPGYIEPSGSQANTGDFIRYLLFV